MLVEKRRGSNCNLTIGKADEALAELPREAVDYAELK
jgi:hypothetical protein